MGAWAETVVHDRDNSYPPRVGEECAYRCGRVFKSGDSAFRLTERNDDDWVCAACERGEKAAPEGMGV